MWRRQDEPGAKKRRVEYSTFLKWKRNLDREYQTMLWLDSDSGKKVVSKLKCKVCKRLEERISSRKNFSSK